MPLPLLLFPQPSPATREAGSSFPPSTHLPSVERQAQRLIPKFQVLQGAFEARRVELQTVAPNEDPDLVLVLETVGAINDFASAVSALPGLEWLTASIDHNIQPDADFFDSGDASKSLGGRLFMLGSNRQALAEIVALWRRYERDQKADMGRPLNAWKGVFKHLKDVRFWSAKDRLQGDLKASWEARLQEGVASIKFEIEAWCFATQEKNDRASNEIRRLLADVGGRVLDEILLEPISYHGFLVEVAAEGVQRLLADTPAELVLSERVMLFRPRGQAMVTPSPEDVEQLVVDGVVPTQIPSGSPVVAMLDGLPLENHPRLAGRLMVDDPQGWAETYLAEDRIHGTAMASLIAWGELTAGGPALPNPIYVRPILRPDPSRVDRPRPECTPDDRLLIDLIHSAVRRIFEGEGDAPAAAPTVKVINLSVGDQYQPFDGAALSPWARLLDWLSHKYKVLFIVSAGNAADDLSLQVARETLGQLTVEQRSAAAMRALLSNDSHKRLFAPAESINALTVGAAHVDGSISSEIPGRHVLFPDGGVAPYSCIGPGFRRSMKPDILLPGGKLRYMERYTSTSETSSVRGLFGSPVAPGHLAATPPDAAGQNTRHFRGTSNAAALGTRGAAQALTVIDALRAGNPSALPSKFDAVLLKALLAHGADVGEIKGHILDARPDVTEWQQQRRLIARYAGYGFADIDRALTCTEQRATLIGVGELRNEKALEFRAPLPPSLNASREKRRLTVTLAWLSPTYARSSRYRAARLWIDVPEAVLQTNRIGGEYRQVQLGTLQHEVFEGGRAVPIVDGQELVLKVNCVADAGRIASPIEFALCATLEVAEGIDLPIYQEVRERVSTRVGVMPSA